MFSESRKKGPKDKLRNIDGWNEAPVPICMGGDYRALAWCCKPGYSLTFGFKCLRDQVLKEIGLSSEKFLEIKENFSKLHDWDSEYPCFGSFSYCCMRNSGCSRRDTGLISKFKGMSFDEIKREYFILKKELSNLLLKEAKNKELVKDYIEE